MSAIASPRAEPLFTSGEWTLELLDRISGELERIAEEELRLDIYPYRMEVIASEQMLDAYASVGMPVYYHHWSFGKRFLEHERQYRSGRMGLAYEIVINSNPCVAYLMDGNTATMMALVIAHAAFGHNAFMKNNAAFAQWTQADYILDYLAYARRYVAECEERWGMAEVEALLDACHALAPHGVDRYQHPDDLSLEQEEARERERAQQREVALNDLWRVTVPSKRPASDFPDEDEPFPKEPHENILRFIEEHAPELPHWKREIIRIVRTIAQYFYPQRQTKALNEGFACFVHYYLMSRLLDKGLITDGAYMEFLHSHTNVLDQPHFSGMNPYALGFALFQDIKRMCEHPTDEDREWFPDIAGSDWLAAIKFAAENFRDESGILQFLSPKVMRDFRLFSVLDDSKRGELEVTAIHNQDGYRQVRRVLAGMHDPDAHTPLIEVSSVKRKADRSMVLRHTMKGARPIAEKDAKKTLQYVEQLWGFPVALQSWDSGSLASAIMCQKGEVTDIKTGRTR